ncbi:ATP-dependent RNA helicase Chl1, putative [Candida dubliniensis CD36]|uniref:ATP-dependent DNA helicase CHL1 n=1 Tax=Candida dubliniensis (strain CD36 / ATCC MYA-646 / CBS 7987 / NCPF 3949 / NRRL Y-17841) TaxID=573826 RepID=B9WAH2_CANDC|nr:ATP-dependent RNA helicase Chl1, putative [Candida dubliniensis CD36]CAX43392.1 ATP-dependent RNA helicase Chl1, putative [Candida dubliniensis CD36]
MVSESCSRNYNHPYTPYDIQIQLMDAIYDTIENGYKIGLFESPTGTGKTLSIICSSMTWLRNFKRNNTFLETGPKVENGNEGDSESDSEDDEPEWVKQAYRSSIVNRSKNKLIEYEHYLDKMEKEHTQNKRKEEELKEAVHKRRKAAALDSAEESFLPMDYYSDSEIGKTEDQNLAITKEINRLLKKVENKEEVSYINECPIKIFFSSRTHSQLNQFSSQLRLTNFQASFEDLEERTKYIPLGSRKQLCINDKVRAKGNDQSVNDACIDLQRETNGCQYLPKNYMMSNATKEFADLSLAKIRDIEDLNQLGTELNICPYYSVRKGIDMTEIISLPYQMIFQDTTRKILNLDIKDSIIIIDEAHNIIDVITSMYSIKVTSDQLNKVIKSLKVYLNKFLKRLNSGNRINLMKLIKICQILLKFLNNNQGSVKSGDEIQIQDIFKDSTGDLVNIHKLDEFLTKSKIAYKIESYIEKIELETGMKKSSSNPLLFTIIKFLKTLTNLSKEGKFFWDNENGSISLNYMLLDPSAIFKEIVDQAKCVLLCGGTMEPMADYMDYLFPTVPTNKINTFACGHVIPKENLEVFPVSQWNDTNFEFSFQKRNDPKQLTSLGEFLIEITKRVPYGVVIFFPSYKYLDQVLQFWKNTGILSSIESNKTIFREPTDPSNVEKVLSQYGYIIQTERKGAMLFSVVGGKMSEGINFSDDLARAVIMVGLPYPNAYSGEMVTKRKFIETSVLKNGGTANDAREKSKNYYENLCMRAVNQSIGRSIRHVNDYSIIYLVDRRFSFPRIQNKLSQWVKERISTTTNNNAYIMESTTDFFNIIR